ncbi:MAG TPA: phosphodiester glycosidase family protein [Nocardioides sp.]|nr:phosphodiester glycosidase family protein [Nocardioides sp.]
MRLFPALLCLALPLTLAPASATTSPTPRPHQHHWQTSEHVVGPARPTAPPYARVVTRTRLRFGYQVRPGIHVASYQQRIGARNIRYYLVTIDWRRRGVGFTLAQPRDTDMVQRVRWMTEKTPHAVVGVNGDFFDIGRTGAPLGLGVLRGRVQHGINAGWNRAFYVDRRGDPHIGEEPLTAVSPTHPKLGVTNVNSPWVRPGGIGVYNFRWGRTAGRAWVQGDKDVLMAHLVDHRVEGFATTYPAGQLLTGQYLVARGAEAVARLKRLSVGDSVRLRISALHQPRMAVTGNAYLVQGGKIVATDDTELHPRTAVGIDRGRHRVYLLVVEGRQEFSDGFTMVELARKFRALGCDGALNLDGGGSTTLVAQERGALQLLNSPSDGQQRAVANALAVTYVQPRRRHHHHH